VSYRFSCPGCKELYEAVPAQAGMKFDCEKCGQRLQTPPAPFLKKTLLANAPDGLPWATAVENSPTDEPTIRCFRCRTRIPESQTVGREMKTAQSGGSFGQWGGGSAWFQQSCYAKVDICLKCNAELDRQREALMKLLLGALVVIGIVIFFVYAISFFSH
jgi:DNA-directed RNA polymerase subunit RPC12/RpoP